MKMKNNPFVCPWSDLDGFIGSSFDPTPFIQDLASLTLAQCVQLRNYLRWILDNCPDLDPSAARSVYEVFRSIRSDICCHEHAERTRRGHD